MASDRTALRLEHCTAVVRCQPERAYNRGDEVFLPMGSDISLEWRRLWTRRRALDDDFRNSFVFCIGAGARNAAACGYRSNPQRTALTALLLTLFSLGLC